VATEKQFLNYSQASGPFRLVARHHPSLQLDRFREKTLSGAVHPLVVNLDQQSHEIRPYSALNLTKVGKFDKYSVTAPSS
jgi:hypothetical protein